MRRTITFMGSPPPAVAVDDWVGKLVGRGQHSVSRLGQTAAHLNSKTASAISRSFRV